jgi:hypothetical protein
MESKRNLKTDWVDVHISASGNNRVDAHSRYPLLDGLKTYTVKLTSLVAPLTQDAIPEHGADGEAMDNWFEVRRRVVGQAPNHANTQLSTLAGLDCPTANEFFKKDARRSVSNLGDLVFHLNNYFEFIRTKYVTLGNIIGATHGGHANEPVAAGNRFCDVLITPNGHLRFMMSPMFCKNFYIVVSDYAQSLFGFEAFIAFRKVPADPVAVPPLLEQNLTGTVALLGAGNVILASGALLDTVDHRSGIPASRHLEHRIRIEVESQMPIQNTVVWNNEDSIQQLNTTIASFPIRRESRTTIELNNMGISENSIKYESSLLNGNIVFRESNNLVLQSYRLQNAQSFHNIRLELFMIRKEWKTQLKKFIARRRKMVFGKNQSFSAKLRFESI